MLEQRLKQLRGKRTQEEIAHRLGISRARYSHYENGRSEPDTELLQKIADIYHVNVDYLLGRTDDQTPSNKSDEYDYTKDPTVSGELREFLDDLTKLPPEEQEEIINMARTFVAGLKTRNRPTR